MHGKYNKDNGTVQKLIPAQSGAQRRESYDERNNRMVAAQVVSIFSSRRSVCSLSSWNVCIRASKHGGRKEANLTERETAFSLLSHCTKKKETRALISFRSNFEKPRVFALIMGAFCWRMFKRHSGWTIRKKHFVTTNKKWQISLLRCKIQTMTEINQSRAFAESGFVLGTFRGR